VLLSDGFSSQLQLRCPCTTLGGAKLLRHCLGQYQVTVRFSFKTGKGWSISFQQSFIQAGYTPRKITVEGESRPVDGNKEIYKLTGRKSVCSSILSACDDSYGTVFTLLHREYGRKVSVFQRKLLRSSLSKKPQSYYKMQRSANVLWRKKKTSYLN
jgi:hypothetical protein